VELYKTIGSVTRNPRLIGYHRVLQRAWDEFALNSVVCVNNVPTLYRIVSKTILTSDELAKKQCDFWNQGIASVLLIVDPKSVYIYSGLQPPRKQTPELFVSDNDAASPLLQKFDAVAFSQEQDDILIESISNGEYYRRYSDKFKASSSVDQCLSDNLHGLCESLTKTTRFAALDESTAHNFICRLLFACYLVDRGICQLPKTKESRLHQALIERDNSGAIDYLYEFFASLKSKFNGSMFELDLPSEKKFITPDHMESIKWFLEGNDFKTKQRTLGFWAYNFKLIPIETISGIYENFLTKEDRDVKGAYYTPRFLAEMTADVAVDGLKAWYNMRYLDPCCGSGVFLVTLFNRLAMMWELRNKHLKNAPNFYERKDRALRDILRNQICGVDENESACILACFSLYVALLDSFEPSDITTYIKKSGHNRLPKLLIRKGGRRSSDPNDIPVVYTDDSLATDRFADNRFDVLIGNPPWGGGKRGKEDIARKFLDRADGLLKPGGSACLLLPSRIFLNLTNDAYQAKWLSENTLERLVQLADFRHILFPSAKCPCMILKFRPEAPNDLRHAFQYDAPKFDTSSRRQGLVLITEADRKCVSQMKMRNLAEQNLVHAMWKRLFWGTPRDQRFIDYLDAFPKLRCTQNDADSNGTWTHGVGFQPNSSGKCKKPKDAWWNANDLYLPARKISSELGFLLFPDDAKEIGSDFQGPRRAPENKSIFTPPVVLISKGFRKVLYCDFPVLFQDAFQAIHGPKEDEDLLLFLTAYLKSNLANYYCFHVGATMGVERDIVRQEQILDLPFPLPAAAPSKNAARIVKQVANLLRAEKECLERMRSKCTDRDKWLVARAARTRELQVKTNELVYQYFDVQDCARWLVEDMVNIFQPSSTPTVADKIDLPTLYPVNRSDIVLGYQLGLQVYADALTSTLNDWAEERGSAWRVTATGGVDEESCLALVSLHLSRKDSPYQTYTLNASVWKDLFNRFAEQKVILRHERQIFNFLGDTFHILRPISLMHWTRTAAVNDADELFGQIQSMRRGK